MIIVVRRSFPWFPVALAAGWILMMSLAVRDLAWFSAASMSFGDRTTPASSSVAVPAGKAVKPGVGLAPCAAAAITPAVRVIR